MSLSVATGTGTGDILGSAATSSEWATLLLHAVAPATLTSLVLPGTKQFPYDRLTRATSTHVLK